MYSVLADLVLVGHVTFVIFVVAGAVLVVRWNRLVWIHLPCAAWGAWIELTGGVCPLTPLEISLRRRAGEAGYSESFLEHYVVPLLYPGELTREIQITLGLCVIVLNAALYTWAWRRRRGERERQRAGAST